MLPETKAEQFFPYYNEKTGLIELIDSISGNVIGVQTTPQDIWKNKESTMIPVQVDGREVWVEKGVSPDRIPRKTHWVYSNTVAEMICQRVLNGEALTKICKDSGFPPYSTVCRWRSEHEAFAKMLEDARRYRAEHFHDQIIELAEDGESDEEEVARRRLEIESKKWLAEKGDRTRYGNSQNKDLPSGGLVLVVNTGILRPGDPGYGGERDVTNQTQILHAEPTASVPRSGDAPTDQSDAPKS